MLSTSGEQALQGIFGQLTGSGSYSVVNDRSSAALFTPAGAPRGATILIELAGQGNSNVMGLHQAGDTNAHQVLTGSDADGAHATIEFAATAPGARG